VEFVPLEEASNPSPRGFGCWEVEKGQRYVVTLTTCAGLYRYLLGDVVEFDTIPDKPHTQGGGGGDGPARLRIVGRHKHFINAFGENLIVEHIENAVARAASVAQVVVGEFTAAPVYPQGESKAGLELAVELASAASAAQLQAFGSAFDASLKEQNADYTTKRTEGLGMQPPTISPLPVGTFHRWLASKGKLGGQHKCPRCANHRDIIEAVKASQGGV
jgi:acyl-CoA synthetase (AMP-forming)/AMP-acid ligase II